MRFNPYDNVLQTSATATNVAISSFTGSSAVTSDKFDTLGIESLMLHIRTEVDTGGGSASTLAWKIQESDDGSTNWADAKDNTGTVIGATVNNHVVASEIYARIEGIGLQSTGTAPAVPGGRKRYLRTVITPAGTGSSSPTFLAYAEFIGSPGNGIQLPVRTTTSNT